VAKFAENEWTQKILLSPEERILINPLDLLYKELLEKAAYTDEDILSEVEKRLDGKTELYTPPEKEILYQLFPLVSVAKKGSHSREARLVVEMVSSQVKERLTYALDNLDIEMDVLNSMRPIVTVEVLSKEKDINIDIPREDVFRLIPPHDRLRYLVTWSCLSDYDLTQYYITQGWAPLTKEQLITVYTLLLGKTLREYIDQKREEHTSQQMKLPPLFGNVLKLLSSRVPAVSVQAVGATDLDESAFPPCVREALQGASSGLRNYAITVLLTSFLSYARVYPSPTAFDPEKKPELSAEQVDILLEEVVPLIIEAGNRCDPPLFTDQPIERLNVYYHLGFGLNDSPRHTDFGSSTWYLPPSCKKIKQNAPSLCKPDTLCSEGTYAVADREKLETLIDMNAGDPLKVLLAVKRSRNPQKIVEISGVNEGEVRRILRNLEREGIIFQIRVKNPLVYYVRKIRRKKNR
jgi:DNA primase large subunit